MTTRLQASCPHCGVLLEYPSDASGSSTTCPSCSGTLLLPALIRIQTPPPLPKLDPSVELLRLCDSIVEDGELSGEEIYELAEWLNNHRDACLIWPGSELVAPLQEVWRDGKTTKTELRAIAKLLKRIIKEAIKREVDAASAKANEVASVALRTLDSHAVTLPLIPMTMSVSSFSEPGVLYEVDLRGPSCTCPDWISRRKGLPRGHLSRCCKHILNTLSRLDPEGGWPPHLAAFLSHSYAPKPNSKWKLIPGESEGEGLLVSIPDQGWADVFVLARGEYQRYGFNIDEQRWAYGESPPGYARFARDILRRA